MTIRPPGTSITFFGPTDALGLASGAGEVEPGGGADAKLGSGEVDGLFNGDTLDLLAVGADDELSLDAGLVLGVVGGVSTPLARGVWMTVGLTLGVRDGEGGAVVLALPVLAAATLADDDAAAAEFWLI